MEDWIAGEGAMNKNKQQILGGIWGMMREILDPRMKKWNFDRSDSLLKNL